MEHATIRGTTEFWFEPEPTRDRYQDGRNCVLCGGPLTDWATGRLCRACNNKKKGTKVQALTRHLVWKDRQIKGHAEIKAWFERVRPPVSLRVVGITLWDASSRALLEASLRMYT